MKKLIGYAFWAEVLFCTVMLLLDLWRKSSINSTADVIVLIGISLFAILMNVTLAALIYAVSEA